MPNQTLLIGIATDIIIVIKILFYSSGSQNLLLAVLVLSFVFNCIEFIFQNYFYKLFGILSIATIEVDCHKFNIKNKNQ